MGEHYLGELTERERRIATGFSGGIGGTKQELCGVFTMGAAVISALYGRTSSEMEDQDCQDLVALYRQRFLDRFGTLQCAALRENGYGSEDGESCSILAERGVQILMEVIEACRQEGKV